MLKKLTLITKYIDKITFALTMVLLIATLGLLVKNLHQNNQSMALLTEDIDNIDSTNYEPNFGHNKAKEEIKRFNQSAVDITVDQKKLLRKGHNNGTWDELVELYSVDKKIDLKNATEMELRADALEYLFNQDDPDFLDSLSPEYLYHLKSHGEGTLFDAAMYHTPIEGGNRVLLHWTTYKNFDGRGEIQIIKKENEKKGIVCHDCNQNTCKCPDDPKIVPPELHTALYCSKIFKPYFPVVLKSVIKEGDKKDWLVQLEFINPNNTKRLKDGLYKINDKVLNDYKLHDIIELNGVNKHGVKTTSYSIKLSLKNGQLVSLLKNKKQHDPLVKHRCFLSTLHKQFEHLEIKERQVLKLTHSNDKRSNELVTITAINNEGIHLSIYHTGTQKYTKKVINKLSAKEFEDFKQNWQLLEDDYHEKSQFIRR